jgi:hypothetical protein
VPGAYDFTGSLCGFGTEKTPLSMIVLGINCDEFLCVMHGAKVQKILPIPKTSCPKGQAKMIKK